MCITYTRIKSTHIPVTAPGIIELVVNHITVLTVHCLYSKSESSFKGMWVLLTSINDILLHQFIPELLRLFFIDPVRLIPMFARDYTKFR